MADNPRVYIFHGSDAFSAEEELRGLRERLDTDGNLSHNTFRFDARNASGRDSVRVDDVIAACLTASFFAETRLVVVHGLLGRVGGGGRGSRRGRAGAGRAGDAERLDDALESLPPTTTIVMLEDDKVPKARLDALRPFAVVKEFKALPGPGVRAWAQKRAETLGARITADALHRLTDLIDGHHLGDLALEIDKLATYAAGRPIEVEDVDELVGAALQLQTWDLTDAVVSGRADRALGVLQKMDAGQHPGQLLFSMIVRQYRQLILVKAMKGEGLGEAEIGRRLGVGVPFPLSKLVEQAGRYQSEKLDQAYGLLLETDVAVKTGVMDIDTALEMLIVQLATMVGAGRPVLAGRR